MAELPRDGAEAELPTSNLQNSYLLQVRPREFEILEIPVDAQATLNHTRMALATVELSPARDVGIAPDTPGSV
jgi:hypothetical protein